MLTETGEARTLLEAGVAPVGAVTPVEDALARTERGGVIGAGEFSELAALAEVLGETRRRLVGEAERAPHLAARGEPLPDHSALAREIRSAFDPEGQLRDHVSPHLAEARHASRRLASEVQQRMQRHLRDNEVAPHLQDSFVTVRGGRYVLPVRAEARSSVPGIVHDASASGTTIFVEPEALVPLNNRLRENELQIERETRRVLQEFSMRFGEAAPALRSGLRALATIDLVFARAALAIEQEAVPAEIRDEGVIHLPALRHPLLPPAEVVENDLSLGLGFHCLILSGPNAGGKTVAMKATALAVLATHAGLHCCAGPGARVDFLRGVIADIGDAQSLRDNLSTFSAHLRHLAHITDDAERDRLVVLDEIGDGTDPGEGAALAQAVLESLADAGTRVIATTHYNLLKELAAADPRFENGSFEFDAETLAPTYRLRLGTPGVSSATAVAARMGVRQSILDRANELLDRDDRRLEKTLAELSESRLALERERSEAERLRGEAESDRTLLRQKLEQLSSKRDRLYDELRSDLEASFRGAREEVAQVIRSLQRGGTDAKAASRASQRLARIEQAARAPGGSLEKRTPSDLEAIDWQHAKAGDPVLVPGGRHATLLSLPDQRGRITVQSGSARLVLKANQVGKPAHTKPNRSALASGGKAGARSEPKASEVHQGRQRKATNPLAHPTDPDPRTRTVDLRGQRADEAIDTLEAALDQAALSGSARLLAIHGFGTGALRKAVHDFLRRSAYVDAFASAARHEGGDGATDIKLKNSE